MTTKTLLKKLLGVKDLVVESFRLETLPDETLKLIIRVRPTVAMPQEEPVRNTAL